MGDSLKECSKGEVSRLYGFYYKDEVQLGAGGKVDTLGTWYENYKQDRNEFHDEYSAFASGVTKGAVSMRERAMKVVRELLANDSAGNKVLDALGELADYPEQP